MLLLTLGACKVESADDNDATAGNGQGGGAPAGNGQGGGASGQGGSAGAAENPCGDLPASGRCAPGNRSVEYCRVPPPGSADPPSRQTVACEAFEVCGALGDGSAACVLDASAGVVCRPNDTLCEGDVLQTCAADGKSFAATDCAAESQRCLTPPQQAARCVAFTAAGGSGGPRLKGSVKFERRGMSETGPAADVKSDPAWLDFVAIYNGADYIGSAITDATGHFDAELTQPAKADTTVYVFAMDFDAKTQQPLVAIVHNDDPNIDTQRSNGYWFWRNDEQAYRDKNQGVITVGGDGNAEMSEFVITEAQGSGALRVFQWVRYAMLRLDDPGGLVAGGLASTRGKPQQTIAVFWEPGVDSVCGACFLGRQGGGATVAPEGTTTVDHFDTLMQVSGSNDNPTHWSYSVLSHEAGHWVMANYSRSPGEGGPHFVAQASKPGLAWSEGWATAFGQWNSSDGPSGDYDPLYFDTQDGTTFWINIATATYTAGALQKPSPDGPLDQPVNENVVSSMVWHLWQPEAARYKQELGGTDPGAYAGVGDDKMFQAVQSDRVLKPEFDRGYGRVDLLDFYDAAVCTQAATEPNVSTVAGDVGYPWDGAPRCP
jgi:hypothetical protein